MGLVQGCVFKSITLTEDDLSTFEDDPQEYIREKLSALSHRLRFLLAPLLTLVIHLTLTASLSHGAKLVYVPRFTFVVQVLHSYKYSRSNTLQHGLGPR